MISCLRDKGWFFFGALVVLLYFSYFVLPGLHSRFNIDDPMNIYYVWSRGGWELLKGLLLFFTPYYRPMGGLFFFSLYGFFGLNPLPYHIVITVILLINVVLAYRCAVLLSGSRTVGGLCALFASYHANMSQAVYLPAFIFDALCFTFFLAALVYYLGVRSAGRTIGKKELLIFILLYVAALESKEMAVTLPVMLLIYEVLWNPPSWSVKGFLAWVRSAAFTSLTAGLVTVAYIVGKSAGAESLSNNPYYKVTISLQTFLHSQVKFFRELFYLKPHASFNELWLVIIWLLLFYAAHRRHENYLKWATLMTVIGPLPIAFIPDRGGICLCIPWFGWTLWLGALSAIFSSYISGRSFVRHTARRWVQAVLILVIVGLAWHKTDRRNREIVPAYQGADGYFWSLKEQLGKLLPSVKAGTQIAYYNDDTDSWDARFVTELFFHDRSVYVRLHRYNPLSPDEFNKVDYVLNMERQKLAILKRPGEPFQVPPGVSRPTPK
jgi:hypothetical protein